jgi:hypothetical protein
LQQQNKLASFERAVLPHLDAVYNLACEREAEARTIIDREYSPVQECGA